MILRFWEATMAKTNEDRPMSATEL